MENEFNKKDASNTEGVNNFPKISRASDSEAAIVAETKTSLTRDLTALHVDDVYECVGNDNLDVVAKGVRVPSQK